MSQSVSDFLLYCARCIESREWIDPALAPSGWVEYIALTEPPTFEWDDSAAIAETRSLRFMLAAAIAKSEGR